MIALPQSQKFNKLTAKTSTDPMELAYVNNSLLIRTWTIPAKKESERKKANCIIMIEQKLIYVTCIFGSIDLGKNITKTKYLSIKY